MGTQPSRYYSYSGVLIFFAGNTSYQGGLDSFPLPDCLKAQVSRHPTSGLIQVFHDQAMVAQYEQEVKAADIIVAQETNPRTISTKLIAHFDLTKEGEDIASETKRRKGQDYFRHMILANYGGRCALTGIDIPQLLLASHIIPWSDKLHKRDRLNPCNGICLSALYDKAFDQGLITFSPDDFSVQLSSALRENESKEYYNRHFGSISGKKLTLPAEYQPNLDFLAYHRDKVFVGF